MLPFLRMVSAIKPLDLSLGLPLLEEKKEHNSKSWFSMLLGVAVIEVAEQVNEPLRGASAMGGFALLVQPPLVAEKGSFRLITRRLLRCSIDLQEASLVQWQVIQPE